MQALADRHTVAPVMLTDRSSRVDIPVAVARTTHLLEVPVGWVLITHVFVDDQVPLAVALACRALQRQVPFEIGFQLGKVEEGVGVGMVHEAHDVVPSLVDGVIVPCVPMIVHRVLLENVRFYQSG